MDQNQLIEKQKRHQLRLLYSLGDLRMALSAADFLYEVDEDQKYSTVELRRFRCYETTLIVSYARPFSESRGGIPKLSLGATGADLSSEQQTLHAELIRLRNKVFAHSDVEMMRMVVQTFPLADDFDFVALHTVFDEGLTLIGEKLWRVNDLLRVVHGSLYEKLLSEAQRQPDAFNLKQDYLSDKTSPT